MLLSLVLKVPRLKYALARVRFLKLYASCLEISSKGWFFAWIVFVMISVVASWLESAFDLIDEYSAVLGAHGLGVMLIVVISLPLGILIFVTCMDCMIAGLRARNQFLLGSLFSSKSYDEKQAKLLRQIESC
ncbi:hypothetical protein [Parasedimentitalea psychrophila]|uniref:Uncharacterized protein n=1 Tax=Parasedimentitalea psychrophila TaxID=2997337 RepID=A0A9Y2P288_9RHOB|nr:hypothetical protein [Parasedimentitalea psychrophila]WIY26386.1 hypothetical protein QPJ95_05585 [Parasedimentitalea psychrophila]